MGFQATDCHRRQSSGFYSWRVFSSVNYNNVYGRWITTQYLRQIKENSKLNNGPSPVTWFYFICPATPYAGIHVFLVIIINQTALCNRSTVGKNRDIPRKQVCTFLKPVVVAVDWSQKFLSTKIADQSSFLSLLVQEGRVPVACANTVARGVQGWCFRPLRVATSPRLNAGVVSVGFHSSLSKLHCYLMNAGSFALMSTTALQSHQPMVALPLRGVPTREDFASGVGRVRMARYMHLFPAPTVHRSALLDLKAQCSSLLKLAEV